MQALPTRRSAPSAPVLVLAFLVLVGQSLGGSARAQGQPPAERPTEVPAATPPGAPPESAEAARFDILEFLVEGNTVLPVIEIERAVMPFLGEGRRIEDVEAARKSLEDVYQRLGYQTVFVDVPEQRISEGQVRLRVLEGRVERLRVTGSRYFSQGYIRAAVPELAPGSVPDFNAVQGQLANLNRAADRQVTPVLRAGRTPGTVEVELAVKDQRPLHGEVELNNRSSAFTSESRLYAGLRWDNLWQRQHSAGLSVQLSPEASDEVKVLVGNYLWRFDDSPEAVALYAVRSDSKVALVGSSTVLGKATIAGARWVRPITPSVSDPGLFQSLTFGADYKRFDQTNIAAASQAIDILGAIDYVPLSLAYSATLAAPGRSSQLGATMLTAPRGLLGNRDEEFQGRRVLARAGWTVLRFDLAHEQALGPRFSAWAKLEAQWVDVPLISNEQFILGGAESVRGYREAELAGDRGGRLSIELRWWPWRLSPDELQQRAREAAQAAAQKAAPTAAPGSPNVAAEPLEPAGEGLWASTQLYALLDAGAIEIVQSAGPQVARRWIGGLGAGLRWSARGWRAQIEAARALNPGGSGLDGAITDKGDWRVHVRLGLDF